MFFLLEIKIWPYTCKCEKELHFLSPQFFWWWSVHDSVIVDVFLGEAGYWSEWMWYMFYSPLPCGQRFDDTVDNIFVLCVPVLKCQVCTTDGCHMILQHLGINHQCLHSLAEDTENDADLCVTRSHLWPKKKNVFELHYGTYWYSQFTPWCNSRNSCGNFLLHDLDMEHLVS